MAVQIYLTEQQFTVGVAYTWTGLLAPIQAGECTRPDARLPIKFQLTGASAGVTDAEIRLLMFKVSDNVVGDPVEVESPAAATTGNLFSFVNGEYVFNLSTSGLTAGTYQLQVDMGDGVLRAVNISLRSRKLDRQDVRICRMKVLLILSSCLSQKTGFRSAYVTGCLSP